MDKLYTVEEAANLRKVSRQALYLAIKAGKLRTVKENRHMKIPHSELLEYNKHLYSRMRSKFEGKLVFDESEGFISVIKAAELTSINAQKIYYAIRTKKLRARTTKCAWVIHIDDLIKYEKEHLSGQFHEEKA